MYCSLCDGGGCGSGLDAGGDGAEECGDCLSFMVSNFRAVMQVETK